MKASTPKSFIAQIQQIKITSKCWRNCEDYNANFSHTLWLCPVLNSFWEAIHNEVQLILKVNFPLDAMHYLLGMSPLRIGPIEEQDKYLAGELELLH